MSSLVIVGGAVAYIVGFLMGRFSADKQYVLVDAVQQPEQVAQQSSAVSQKTVPEPPPYYIPAPGI